MTDVETLKQQHFSNYKNAVIEIINNNTDALFDEDIRSLFKKPPLDSMDALKMKIIGLAKKENNVIDSEQLEISINNYREYIFKCLESLKKERKKVLITIIDKFDFQKKESIKLNKKDFLEFDKKTKKVLKEEITKSFSKNILKNVNSLFTNKENELSEFTEQLEEYFNKTYIKQIVSNYEFKVLVKNTILINGVKEQGERYNFTLENSRLFDE